MSVDLEMIKQPKMTKKKNREMFFFPISTGLSNLGLQEHVHKIQEFQEKKFSLDCKKKKKKTHSGKVK